MSARRALCVPGTLTRRMLLSVEQLQVLHEELDIHQAARALLDVIGPAFFLSDLLLHPLTHGADVACQRLPGQRPGRSAPGSSRQNSLPRSRSPATGRARSSAWRSQVSACPLIIAPERSMLCTSGPLEPVGRSRVSTRNAKPSRVSVER